MISQRFPIGFKSGEQGGQTIKLSPLNPIWPRNCLVALVECEEALSCKNTNFLRRAKGCSSSQGRSTSSERELVAFRPWTYVFYFKLHGRRCPFLPHLNVSGRQRWLYFWRFYGSHGLKYAVADNFWDICYANVGKYAFTGISRILEKLTFDVSQFSCWFIFLMPLSFRHFMGEGSFKNLCIVLTWRPNIWAMATGDVYLPVSLIIVVFSAFVSALARPISNFSLRDYVIPRFTFETQIGALLRTRQ